MKPGAGKRKGSSFERVIAKKLSLWFTNGADSTQLIRSVLSGGWSGRGAAGAAWRQIGDLAANGAQGERFLRAWSVECKHRRDISLWQLWTGGELIEWWDKLTQESDRAGVRPLLIFRSNRMPIMVMTRVKLVAGSRVEQLGRQALVAPWRDAIIFPLDDMLKCDPECFLTVQIIQ